MVVVSTCAGASALKGPLSADHFRGGVYVGEAAQVIEPEALVPVAAIAAAAPVVLCGDPVQLNTDVRSGRAAALGEATFLMERIVARRDARGARAEAAAGGVGGFTRGAAVQLFANGGARGSVGDGGVGDDDSDSGGDSDGGLPPRPSLLQAHPFTVPLRINYHARHPALLLTLPSRLFYGGRLLPSPAILAAAAARVPSRPLPAVAPDLFPAGTPLLLVGVAGVEERKSERSPAVRSALEADRVADICARLVWVGRTEGVETGGAGGAGGTGGGAAAAVFPHAVAAADAIGVIAPHRLRVRVVRAVLRAPGLGGVMVGTLAVYHGQEGEVILISTNVTRAS